MAALPRRLVVASHNPGKVREIGALLAPFGIEALVAGDLGLAEPEETEPTFAGNAILKAEAAGAATGLPALADDSGLEAFALGGAPGIYSARWAGPDKDFGLAMRRLQNELEAAGASDRAARFVCVLALRDPSGGVATFEGEVRGRLVWPPRGDQGFGYDPMFVPDGFDQTFGEMEPALKHTMTHRTRAFEKLLDHLR